MFRKSKSRNNRNVGTITEATGPARPTDPADVPLAYLISDLHDVLTDIRDDLRTIRDQLEDNHRALYDRVYDTHRAILDQLEGNQRAICDRLDNRTTDLIGRE